MITESALHQLGIDPSESTPCIVLLWMLVDFSCDCAHYGGGAGDYDTGARHMQLLTQCE
jgi:hypothetical protein